MHISNSLLEAYVAIADSGSLAKASDIVHATPAALSQRIKQLENRLGMTLFVRSSRGMELSDDGLKIYSHIKQIITNINHLTLLSKQHPSKASDITLGVSSSVSSKFIERILHIELTDGASLNLRKIGDDSALQLIQKGKIDAAVTYDVLNMDDNLLKINIGLDNFSILYNKDHPIKNETKLCIITPYIRPLINNYVIPFLKHHRSYQGHYTYIDYPEEAINQVISNGNIAFVESELGMNFVENCDRLKMGSKYIDLPCYLVYKKGSHIAEHLSSISGTTGTLVTCDLS